MAEPDLQHLMAATKEAFFAFSLLAEDFPKDSPQYQLCEDTKRSLRSAFNRTFHPESLAPAPATS